MPADRIAPLLACLTLLAACGELPRPFEGHAGATADRLARPPPARLAVPAPLNALLPDQASAAYADAVAAALQQREVPAIAGPVHRGDWRLDMAAELRGHTVVPSFTVDDPSGKPKGHIDGQPVDAAAWSAGTPGVVQKAAAAAGPQIADLLTSIEAARQMSDPNSLRNRPPRVMVKAVTGAPGDGNTSLTRQMRRSLPKQGEVVQDSADGADFTVAGTVRTAPAPSGQVEVEIQWVVIDAQGHDLGHVVQLNDVPAGTLDGRWGDVAVVVADEAAGGVRDVISKQTGPRVKP